MDNDFISVFFPLFFIGIIVFDQEYKISVRKAGKVCEKKIMYAVIGNGIYFCLLWATIYANPFRSFQFRMFYLFLYFLFLSNFAATCYINLYRNDSNVRILSSLQKINNCLYSSSDLKKFKIFVLAYFCLITSLWITNITGKMVFDPYWIWVRAFFGSVSIIFDLDMAHTLSVVYMLTRKLKTWNDIVENMHFGEESEEIAIDKKNTTKNIYEVNKLICEAWKILNEISGFKVSNNLITIIRPKKIYKVKIKTYILFQILLHFVSTFVMFLMYTMLILIFACTNAVSTRFFC